VFSLGYWFGAWHERERNGLMVDRDEWDALSPGEQDKLRRFDRLMAKMTTARRILLIDRLEVLLDAREAVQP
jgi:hypothetical protein